MPNILQVNRHIFYPDHVLPTYAAHGNGHVLKGKNNLVREAIVGGIVFEGHTVSPLVLEEHSTMSKEEQTAHIESLLLHVTEDPELLEWARYNAHLNGPIGDCLANFQKVLMDVCQLSVRMEQGEGTRNKCHLKRVDNNPNHLMFDVTIVFSSAVTVPDEAEDPILIGLENDDPVLIYQAKFTVEKTPAGIGQAKLVYENARAIHDDIKPHFEKIQAIMQSYVEFREIVHVLQDEVVNCTPKPSLTEFDISAVLARLQKLIALSNNLLNAASTKYDYKNAKETLYKNLVNQRTFLLNQNKQKPNRNSQQLANRIQMFMKNQGTIDRKVCQSNVASAAPSQ